MKNGFVIFIIFMITAAIISAIAYKKKKERDKAIDDSFIRLGNARDTVDDRTRAANEANHVLYKAVTGFRGADDVVRLALSLEDYEKKLSVRSQAYTAFCSADDDSRAQLRARVRLQNEWLGGANDFSARSLYDRQEQLAEMEQLSERLIDGSELRIRAHALLTSMKLNAKLTEKPDRLPDRKDD